MKNTWKLMQARELIQSFGLSRSEIYAQMDKLGYVWHSGKQRWLATIDTPEFVGEAGDTQDTKYESNGFLIDGESAETFGFIMLPCEDCGTEMLASAWKAKALSEKDNEIHNVIVHTAICHNCGNEHMSTITHKKAIELGMIPEEINKPKVINKKGIGRTH